MDIKIEIKEECCFEDFNSENQRDNKDLVKKAKIETSDSDINPEDSTCCSQNEEHHLRVFNKTMEESEKIYIKEEHCWLKREDSSVHDDIKDGTQEDFDSTNPPRLYKEGVSTYTLDLPFTESLENDVGVNVNIANAECGSDRKCQGQESVVTDICSIETGVFSETSDDGKIVSMASSWKQSKLLQQCNANKQDINKQSCKSMFSNEYRKKVNTCDVLNQLSLKTHKCKICRKSFTCWQRLKIHEVNHEGVNPHKCKICDKTFNQSSDLKIHTLIHDGIKQHKCNICNKAFTQLSSLKTHMLTHQGIKPHKCNICNKAFTQFSHLKRHKLTHEGIKPKPHKCNICNKGFTQASHLKEHKLIHDGIKPHKCNFCNSAFTQSSDLKRHTSIHDSRKPQNCNICSKGFIRLSDLKKHNLIHEGIMPHKCNICDKDFTRLSSLKTHKLIHDGIKPHKCNICNKDFYRLGHLKRHKLKHHDTIV